MKASTLTVFIWILAQALALAQVHTAATPVPIVSSTPVPLLSGVLTTITPGDGVNGDTVGLKISPTVELTFRLEKALVVVGADGNVLASPTVTSGENVTVHFIHNGNELVIDRIFLQ